MLYNNEHIDDSAANKTQINMEEVLSFLKKLNTNENRSEGGSLPKLYLTSSLTYTYELKIVSVNLKKYIINNYVTKYG